MTRYLMYGRTNSKILADHVMWLVTVKQQKFIFQQKILHLLAFSFRRSKADLAPEAHCKWGASSTQRSITMRSGRSKSRGKSRCAKVHLPIPEDALVHLPKRKSAQGRTESLECGGMLLPVPTTINWGGGPEWSWRGRCSWRCSWRCSCFCCCGGSGVTFALGKKE